MRLAAVADETGLHAAIRLMAALDTVSLRASALGIVFAGQRMSRMRTRATLAGDVLGRQLLQQLVHELFAEP